MRLHVSFTHFGPIGLPYRMFHFSLSYLWCWPMGAQKLFRTQLLNMTKQKRDNGIGDVRWNYALEERFVELWQQYCSLYDVSSRDVYHDRVKKLYILVNNRGGASATRWVHLFWFYYWLKIKNNKKLNFSSSLLWNIDSPYALFLQSRNVSGFLSFLGFSDAKTASAKHAALVAIVCLCSQTLVVCR